MCGICGFFGTDKKLLKKMCSLLSHRGPDGEGLYTDKHISLGHRRLSIIDVEGGKQPLSNEDGSIWIVYNGEIYNYKELRSSLEGKGHSFSTNSDTEVIVHLYEEYGLDFPKYLNGMFAIALWDSNKKKLHLIRDRLGIKPLHYTNEGIFASEMKAILAHPSFRKKLNKDVLPLLLRYRFIPGENTLFKGIKRVLPAEIVSFSGGKISKRKFWNLSEKKRNPENLRSLIEDSVKIRLMSEVPLGAYLSGGIDSTIITGLMSKFSDKVKTFSIGFGDERHDETNYARIASDHYGTDHTEFQVDSDNLHLLEEVVGFLDEPMSDPTSIPVLILSRLAKKKVTVVLTGEGADEQFGGYEQYKFLDFGKKYGKITAPLAIPALKYTPKPILDLFFKYSSELGKKGTERAQFFLSHISSNNYEKAYFDMVSIFSDEEIKEVSSLQIKDNVPLTEDLNSVMNYEIKTLIPDDLLIKLDRMTMGASVEGRVPFLDHRIIETTSSIPASQKIHKGIDKYILRKTCSDLLPKEIINRKKDRFFVPIGKWFLDKKGFINTYLDKKTIQQQQIFSWDYVEKALEGLKSSNLYYARQLWIILSFQIWYKRFFGD
ncbi:asparagine synthase (glutamine-hydrolyzing) [Candidatus Micrarchaeota archaeon]|nr:asparagine synthase (glutamine-hydrolyzing) [Candidatus Micrarchaeota archaeon]